MFFGLSWINYAFFVFFLSSVNIVMDSNFIVYLKKIINEKKLSHAFLIETNNFNELIDKIYNIFLDSNLINSQGSINNNISVRIIEPENNIIDKDAILHLQDFVLTTSLDNKYKIYFIVNAGLMNMSAVNKLLKILEEPSTDSVGFLLCDSLNSILPTIYSRCQTFVERKRTLDVELDNDILNEVLLFTSFSFENYIKFKSKILKYDKTAILMIFSEYLKYLNKNNDLFYLKVSEFIEKLRYNINIDLYLDKLYFDVKR